MRLTIIFFFFNDTATTEIYTLSLHDALPISPAGAGRGGHLGAEHGGQQSGDRVAVHSKIVHSSVIHGHCPVAPNRDRKSTRLNSSHLVISYAVFCLKKKTFERFTISVARMTS